MRLSLRNIEIARWICLCMAVMLLITGCDKTNSEGGNVTVDKDSSDMVGEGTGAETGTEDQTEPDSQGPDTQKPDTQEPDSQEPDTQEPDTEKPITPPQPEYTAEELLWQTRLLANAKNNLNESLKPLQMHLLTSDDSFVFLIFLSK